MGLSTPAFDMSSSGSTIPIEQLVADLEARNAGPSLPSSLPLNPNVAMAGTGLLNPTYVRYRASQRLLALSLVRRNRRDLLELPWL